MGGHCQAGYWIDKERRTTLKGALCSGRSGRRRTQKYVSGAWVEARIAATTALEDIKGVFLEDIDSGLIQNEKTRVSAPLTKNFGISPLEVRERLQKSWMNMRWYFHELRTSRGEAAGGKKVIEKSQRTPERHDSSK